MIINSLKLKNIRSYLDEEIVFPEGSTMLSGDIGAGKTTILLAIEFALFGIIRGQVSGSSLLRHGKNEGYIELSMGINSQGIIIRRGLKRNGKNIVQDSGYMIVGDAKYDFSPVELKSKVLELIGYPDELVTKSKSLIFRYTVYTPQEEMKQILFEKPEERLDVLRRIFGIDKYKRMKDNTLTYIRELKTKSAALEGRIEDLDAKKEELSAYDSKIKTIVSESKETEKKISALKKDFDEKEKMVRSFEDKLKALNELKRKVDIRKNSLESLKRRALEYSKEEKELLEKTSLLERELLEMKTASFEQLKEERAKLEERRETIEENVDKIKEREATFREKAAASDEVVAKISSLDTCPTCEQKVDDEYKQKIRRREEKKNSDVKAKMMQLLELEAKRREELKSIKDELKAIDEQLKTEQVLKLKKERIAEYKSRVERLKSQAEESLSEAKKTLAELEALEGELKDSKDTEERHTKAKKALEAARGLLREQEIANAGLEREKKTIEEVSQKLREEISRKEEAKKSLSKVKQSQDWFLKYLLNIIYIMEKQIMLRIHQEFNEYFQEWFNTLIEDENLNVRLDETFTPIMEQNGYETFIENLSGGEKTSVALAYRLALNKVINDFIGTIKTKDLLILDEPTDGFSSEQLDKIREVLDKLMIKQIILVSHEPKLESYVDHIIRVNKQEHVSRVIS